MSRKNKHLQHAAAETQTAADKGAAAIDHAAAALHQTLAAVTEYLSTTQERVTPAAKQAFGKTLDAAEKARSQVEPRLSSAYAVVSPGIETARHKVQDDLLPKLTELLHEAEHHPAVEEATKRGSAALAAFKGELSLPEPAPVKRRRSVSKTLAKVVAVGALLAGAAVAVRQFLLSKDDGWTAHEPSPAYTPTRRPEDDVVFTTSTPDAAAADAVTEEVPVHDNVEVEPDVFTEGDPITDMLEEGGPLDPERGNMLDEQAATAAASPYGEGAFVGAEPPEGFVIKGNERSKKYHLPDSGGYERTIADVWFSSEEAAQEAGFSKAQR